jgi:outer membrane protein assembly factor BamB/tetratricopeptide (TPR) repeat protein
MLVTMTGLLAVFLLLPGHASSQKLVAQRPAAAEEPVAERDDNVQLVIDRKRTTQLEAAIDYIATEDWAEATLLLNRLLQAREDALVAVTRKGADGKETKVLLSARSEANRLLDGLPPKGKEHYQKTYGPVAAELLKAARTEKDTGKLADIVRAYLRTESGPEALEALANSHLDSGHYRQAALAYEQLLRHRPLARWSPETLFQAASAFRRVGDKSNAEATTKQLLERLGDMELRLGDRKLSAEDAKKELDKLAPAPTNEWRLYGGNPERSAQAAGGMPFLVPSWSNRTSDVDRTRQLLDQATNMLKQRNQPILSSSFPLAVTTEIKGKPESLLIYRSYNGIEARSARDGKLVWEMPSSFSLDALFKAGAANKVVVVNQWIQVYFQQGSRPGIFFENSALGSLSADSDFVYAIEDLAVPPPPALVNPQFNPGGGLVGLPVNNNTLKALNLSRAGTEEWELGTKDDKNGLNDSFFLGAPLPLEGRLYLLNEKDQDLRLVCIDPKGEKGDKQFRPKVVSLQTLATVRDKLQQDVLRRIQAVHLAYGEGVLVCPTNAGAVFGVDLLTNTVLWAYPYREKILAPPPNPFPRPGFPGVGGNLVSHWRVTAPVIQDGKVVFAAPDSRAIHCLNLRDGSLVWTRKRNEDDLYLAGVFAGKALIVGKKSCYALSLDKGEVAWTVEAGMPTGHGAASENVYYLPVKEAGPDKLPEVCAIDVAKGRIVAHAKMRKRANEPAVDVGNLLFFGNDVVSVSTTTLSSFPQLKIKIEQMEKELAQDENNPRALFELGELRLDQGKLDAGVEALNKALKNVKDDTPAEVKRKIRATLFEALSEFLQRDFGKAEVHLKVYEELCKVDPKELPDGQANKAEAESRHRKSLFLQLLGGGRESQGKLSEALDAYLKLVEEGGGDELTPLVEDPSVKVRREVWVRGRIDGLLKKATPEQRKELEGEIEKRWKALRGAKDEEPLRKFIALFGAGSALGREARFALANRLIGGGEKKDVLEADLLLQDLRRQTDDPVTAGRAVERLAQLYTRHEMFEDAAHYYRVLKRDFAAVKVREGKTSAELFDELVKDKHFSALLKEQSVPLTGKFKAREENGNFPYTVQTYTFERSGEPLPFLQKNKVSLRFDFHQLKVTDRATGEERWTENLIPRTQFQVLTQQGIGNPSNMPKFTYMNMGLLVVLPVGHMVYGLDPVNNKVLWKKDLSSSTGAPNPNPPQWQWNGFNLVVDPRDGSIQIVYADGWMQRLGYVLPVSASAVCLHTRGGLEALDPLSGKTLWSREDVPPRCHIFTDGNNLFVVNFGEDNTPKSTHVLRMSDGSAVKAPDFGALYAKRQRVAGGNILLSETGDKDALTLRLYDVLSGKDVWKETFAAKTILLRSEDPNLTGAAEPDGTLHVYDLPTHKEILKGKLDPTFAEKVDSVHLLTDSQTYFVIVNKQWDEDMKRVGGPQNNLWPGTGMRSLQLNGLIYAFDRANGKLRWSTEVPNQTLLLDQFQEMPLLLCTARYNKLVKTGGAQTWQQIVTAGAFDKRNGKKVYDNENVNPNTQFHFVSLDTKTGKVDLIGGQLKISIAVEEKPAPKPDDSKK